MSMEAGSAGAIALGVVLMVVGALTAEYGGWTLIIVGAGLLTAGALGLMFQPKSPSQRIQRGSQLELATAGEGFPVPVIFGECKVVGNFMRWEKNQFRSVKIYGQPIGAGKGGSDENPKNVQGFDYYLQYEYGLCMGPVDAVLQVWSSPGEIPMRPEPVVELVFGEFEDYKELTLNKNHETGIVRLYKGGADQIRSNPNGSDSYVQDYLSQVVITDGGTGYSANTKATITGDGSGAEVTVIVEAGVITNIVIQNRGYGYTNANIILSSIGGGAGASFDVQLANATMNYRNMCWALFGPGRGFRIGRLPSPKSYQFILRRLPVVKRDDGSTIADFQVRGSGDATKPGYFQANPAAIIYEILTNQLWGRALSSDIIDEPSFIYASRYFHDRNIGMSMTMDAAERIIDVLDGIRLHLRTILLWDGEKLKCRVLMDPATTHSHIQTLSESEVADLIVTRADWVSTINEIRAEFNSRHRNYRPDVIHIQDLANLQIVNRINPMRIQLSGFTDFNIAYKQTQRILREISYPAARASFRINMFKSQLEVGDVFRLIWSEYGTGEQTTYFQVTRKKEAEPDDDQISIEAIEDVDISGVDGRETSIDVPDKQPWEEIPDFNIAEVGLFVIPGTENDEIAPIKAVELSPIVTKGKRELIFLGEAGNDGITGFQIFQKQDNPNFRFLENYDSFAITGQLATPINDGNFFDRTPEGAFEFSLFNVARDEAALLSACSRVVTPSDSLETLINEAAAYMFIDDECIQVGSVVKLDINRYLALNIIRGALGTEIALHATEAQFFFVDAMPLRVSAITLDNNKITQFKVNPIGTAGVTDVGNPFYISHVGEFDQQYIGYGARAMSPIARRIFDNGDGTVTCEMRPRFFLQGAATKPFFHAMTDLTSSLDTMTFMYQQIDAAGNFLKSASGDSYEIPFVLPSTNIIFHEGTLSDNAAGVVQAKVNPLPDCKEIRIFSKIGANRSVLPARFYL